MGTPIPLGAYLCIALVAIGTASVFSDTGERVGIALVLAGWLGGLVLFCRALFRVSKDHMDPLGVFILSAALIAAIYQVAWG